jgi:hypothetical protein
LGGATTPPLFSVWELRAAVVIHPCSTNSEKCIHIHIRRPLGLCSLQSSSLVRNFF